MSEDIPLVKQLEDVLRTHALSAMAVYEQGIHKTQQSYEACLQELYRVQAAAEQQCQQQVEAVQLEYQRQLELLTAHYEEQVQQLEHQTKQRITEIHTEAEEIVTQAAAELLSSLQPAQLSPPAATAMQELLMLQLQQDPQQKQLLGEPWCQQQQSGQQQWQQPASAKLGAAYLSSNEPPASLSCMPSSVAVAATSMAGSPQPCYAEADVPQLQQQQQEQQAFLQHEQQPNAVVDNAYRHLHRMHSEQQDYIGKWQQQGPTWQQRQQHQPEGGLGDTYQSIRTELNDQEATQQHTSYRQHRTSSGNVGWETCSHRCNETPLDLINRLRSSHAHVQSSRRTADAAWPLTKSQMQPSRENASGTAVHNTISVSAPCSRRTTRSDSSTQPSNAVRSGAAASLRDKPGTWMDKLHSLPARLQQEYEQPEVMLRALSASDVLRQSAHSRQDIANSLFQGLKRASSEAEQNTRGVPGQTATLRHSSADKPARRSRDDIGKDVSGPVDAFSNFATASKPQRVYPNAAGVKDSSSKHISKSIPQGQRVQHDQADIPLLSNSRHAASCQRHGARHQRLSSMLDLLHDDDSGSDA